MRLLILQAGHEIVFMIDKFEICFSVNSIWFEDLF